MSKNSTKESEKKALPDLTGLRILPTKEQEAMPPTFVNEIRVVGDCVGMIVNFHYQSAETSQAIHVALHPQGSTRKLEPNMDVEGATLIVRLPTVARISVTSTVALDLALTILETFVDAIPDLKDDMQSIALRMGALGERMSQVTTGLTS